MFRAAGWPMVKAGKINILAVRSDGMATSIIVPKRQAYVKCGAVNRPS